MHHHARTRQSGPASARVSAYGTALSITWSGRAGALATCRACSGSCGCSTAAHLPPGMRCQAPPGSPGGCLRSPAAGSAGYGADSQADAKARQRVVGKIGCRGRPAAPAERVSDGQTCAAGSGGRRRPDSIAPFQSPTTLGTPLPAGGPKAPSGKTAAMATMHEPQSDGVGVVAHTEARDANALRQGKGEPLRVTAPHPGEESTAQRALAHQRMP